MITEFIKHYVDKYDDWDSVLAFAVFNMNISNSETTVFLPFELLFGKQAGISSSFPPIDDLATYNT